MAGDPSRVQAKAADVLDAAAIPPDALRWATSGPDGQGRQHCALLHALALSAAASCKPPTDQQPQRNERGTAGSIRFVALRVAGAAV